MSKNRALGSSVHTTASCCFLFLSKKKTKTKAKIKTMTILVGRGGQGVFAFHAIPTEIFKLSIDAVVGTN